MFKFIFKFYRYSSSLAYRVFLCVCVCMRVGQENNKRARGTTIESVQFVQFCFGQKKYFFFVVSL